MTVCFLKTTIFSGNSLDVRVFWPVGELKTRENFFQDFVIFLSEFCEFTQSA